MWQWRRTWSWTGPEHRPAASTVPTNVENREPVEEGHCEDHVTVAPICIEPVRCLRSAEDMVRKDVNGFGIENLQSPNYKKEKTPEKLFFIFNICEFSSDEDFHI